jgi:hypothetical protein
MQKLREIRMSAKESERSIHWGIRSLLLEFARRARRAGKVAGIGLAASLAMGAPPASAALQFNLTYLPGTSAAEQSAFAAAASVWSSVLADAVTVHLTLGTADLPGLALASAQSVFTAHSYATTRAALVADATSSADATATANLQAGPDLRLLINATANNPNGNTSFTPYIDSSGANAGTIRMTNANARALGLSTDSTMLVPCTSAGAVSCDAFITFDTTTFSWDLDPGDGIGAGLYDFVGIAVHEIGHALGFVSGVDVLDTNISVSTGLNPFADDAFTSVMPLDLFRCSAASAAQAALDWTAGSGTDPKLFSLDGCATSLAEFATGRLWGDGRQASHWKDDQGYGLMDPTSAAGELKVLTDTDVVAFDAIGWNLRSSQAVPGPASALVFVFGLAGLGLARRRGLA